MASETLWIAGHTKSGTTWLKFIVAALLYRASNPKVVERKIPNIEKPKSVKPGGVYKTHVVKPPKGKKLYIVRHPVDVCASGVNHMALPSGKVNVDKYVEKFLEKEGNTIGDFGSWNDGVENWIGCSKWLKYEELLTNTRALVEEIAAYISAPSENVDFAIESTTVAAMKKMERKGVASSKHNVPNVFYNPKHKGYKKGRMFVNRGTSGYAREVLSGAHIEAICKKFERGMKAVGYAPVY